MRADEEVGLIKDEMKSAVSFYLHDWHELIHALTERTTMPCSQYNNGVLSYLQLARLMCEGTLKKLDRSFGEFVDFDEVIPTEKFVSSANIDGLFDSKLSTVIMVPRKQLQLNVAMMSCKAMVMTVTRRVVRVLLATWHYQDEESEESSDEGDYDALGSSGLDDVVQTGDSLFFYHNCTMTPFCLWSAVHKPVQEAVQCSSTELSKVDAVPPSDIWTS